MVIVEQSSRKPACHYCPKCDGEEIKDQKAEKRQARNAPEDSLRHSWKGKDPPSKVDTKVCNGEDIPISDVCDPDAAWWSRRTVAERLYWQPVCIFRPIETNPDSEPERRDKACSTDGRFYDI